MHALQLQTMQGQAKQMETVFRPMLNQSCEIPRSWRELRQQQERAEDMVIPKTLADFSRLTISCKADFDSLPAFGELIRASSAESPQRAKATSPLQRRGHHDKEHVRPS
jgi:hypothetical protein